MPVEHFWIPPAAAPTLQHTLDNNYGDNLPDFFYSSAPVPNLKGLTELSTLIYSSLGALPNFRSTARTVQFSGRDIPANFRAAHGCELQPRQTKPQVLNPKHCLYKPSRINLNRTGPNPCTIPTELPRQGSPASSVLPAACRHYAPLTQLSGALYSIKTLVTQIPSQNSSAPLRGPERPQMGLHPANCCFYEPSAFCHAGHEDELRKSGLSSSS